MTELPTLGRGIALSAVGDAENAMLRSERGCAIAA